MAANTGRNAVLSTSPLHTSDSIYKKKGIVDKISISTKKCGLACNTKWLKRARLMAIHAFVRK